MGRLSRSAIAAAATAGTASLLMWGVFPRAEVEGDALPLRRAEREVEQRQRGAGRRLRDGQTAIQAERA
jgi:hypothetical protein